MKVAEIIITIATFGRDPSNHVVTFTSVEEATKKFDDLCALLKRRGEKQNDLPKWYELEGITKLTCEFDHIIAVAYADFARIDKEQIGMKDTFPHLNWNGK